MNKKNIFIFIILFLISCSSSDKTKVKKPEIIPAVDILYRTALTEFKAGRLENSVELFKKIESNYGYTPYAQKSVLMIAYIYYESNYYIKSLEYIKKFKELYPSSKNFGYAEFLTAMCLYEQINTASKDQEPTLLALKQFNLILQKYPKSIYAEESKIRIDLIYEQMAAHEMYLARYYMKKEKWISAILRLQTVIEKYKNSIFIEEALHRIVEINYRIGNLEAAKKYAAVLGYNFNNSDWYKKTYKIVGDKNYSIINKEKKRSVKNKFLDIFSFGKDD